MLDYFIKPPAPTRGRRQATHTAEQSGSMEGGTTADRELIWQETGADGACNQQQQSARDIAEARAQHQSFEEGAGHMENAGALRKNHKTVYRTN